jgi:hypothetical protein
MKSKPYDSSNVPNHAIALSSSNNVSLVVANYSTIDLKLFKCLTTKSFLEFSCYNFFYLRTFLLQHVFSFEHIAKTIPHPFSCFQIIN